MSFTAGDVLRAATRVAPPIRKVDELQKELIGVFNERLPEIVLEVAQQDPERLMGSVTIPNSVVSTDPVDLTDDGSGSGTIEWFIIGYIDAVDSGGDVIDEVWITAIEARNRGKQDYQVYEAPVAYLRNQLRELKQLDGWGDVDTLTVYGVQKPSAVTEANIDSTSFDYPYSLRQLLVWEVVTCLAPLVKDLSGAQLQTYENRRSQAYDRMLEDAGMAVSRIEPMIVQTEI